jgi:hypothetical protein
MKDFKVQIIVIALVLAIAIGFSACVNFNDHTYTIEVTDKERVNYDDGGKYLIYGRTGDDIIVIENTDSLLRGKFNSSDIYAKIEVGKTYEFTVVGYRIPILSNYENIINFKEISE